MPTVEEIYQAWQERKKAPPPGVSPLPGTPAPEVPAPGVFKSPAVSGGSVDFGVSPEELMGKPLSSQEIAELTDPITGGLRETPETQKTREFLPALLAGETSATFGQGMRATLPFLLTIGEEGRANVIKNFIPGAKKRTDEKGNVFMDFPDGNSVIINKPGFSLQDAVDLTTFGKLFKGASTLGKAALKGLGRGKAAQVAGSIGAQTTTEALRQEALQPVSEQEESLGDIVATGALATAVEAGIPGARKIKRIFPMGKLKKIKERNIKTAEAVESVLNRIAPPENVETAAGKVRSAAQQAIEAKKAIREEAVSPLYKAAKAVPDLFELPKTRTLIRGMKERFKPGGDIHTLLGKVERKLVGEAPKKGKFVVGEQKPEGVSTAHLHGSKLEIDKMLNKFGEDSLSNTERRLVSEIKNSFLEELEEVNPLYGEARKEFIAKSPAVEELQNSILKNIAELKDTELNSVSKRIYDPKNVNNISTIKLAKKSIEDQDPQVWKDITRVEIEERLSGLREDIDVLTTKNFPSKIRNALFGNIKQKKVLYAGLDKEEAKNFRFFEHVLAQAEKGDVKPTIAQAGATAAFRSYFSPMFATTGAAKDLIFRNKKEVILSSLTDPKWEGVWSELRKLNPQSKKFESGFTKFLNQIEKTLPAKTQAIRAISEQSEESQ